MVFNIAKGWYKLKSLLIIHKENYSIALTQLKVSSATKIRQDLLEQLDMISVVGYYAAVVQCKHLEHQARWN